MTDSPIKVVNNFLPPEVFRKLAYMLMTIDSYRCHDFTVFETEADGSIDMYGERNVHKGEVKLHEILFTTRLLYRSHNSEIIQDAYHMLRAELTELYKVLNIKTMYLLRANCTQATDKNYVSKWHTDLGDQPKSRNMKTAILYLNSNNGGTKFQDTDEFVQSASNRCVIFPQHTKHAGVWSTDKKLRYVLNINYTEN